MSKLEVLTTVRKKGGGAGDITTKNLGIVRVRPSLELQKPRLQPAPTCSLSVCMVMGTDLTAYYVLYMHDAALANMQLRLGLCTTCDIRGFNGVGNIR